MKIVLTLMAGIMAMVPPMPSSRVETFMLIRGTVIDEVTQRPVVSARVRLSSSNRVVYTDSVGRYEIDSVVLGNMSVQAEAAGYIREARDIEAPFPPHVFCGGSCEPWRPVVVLNFYMRRRPMAES